MGPLGDRNITIQIRSEGVEYKTLEYIAVFHGTGACVKARDSAFRGHVIHFEKVMSWR